MPCDHKFMNIKVMNIAIENLHKYLLGEQKTF